MNGSCACGKVTYRCGPPLTFVNCHCTLCRSMNGAAFSSYLVGKADTVELSGEAHLAAYMATDTATKHFCSACGTPVYNTNPVQYPGVCMFSLGTVRDAETLVPHINIFCRSKLEWVDRLSEQRCFSAAPQRGG